MKYSGTRHNENCLLHSRKSEIYLMEFLAFIFSFFSFSIFFFFIRGRRKVLDKKTVRLFLVRLLSIIGFVEICQNGLVGSVTWNLSDTRLNDTTGSCTWYLHEDISHYNKKFKKHELLFFDKTLGTYYLRLTASGY